MKNLNLDLNNFTNNIGSIEKNDTATLNIKLDDKDYSNSIIRLLAKKSDKTVVEQLNNIKVSDNTIDILLDNQITAKDGIVRLELNIVTGDEEWTSKEFYFYVSNNLNSETIESATVIPTLQKTSKYVDDAMENLYEFKVVSNELLVANKTYKLDEENRKAREILREKNEKIRVAVENLRLEKENERLDSEVDREEAELERKSNELARRTSENLRISKEKSREEAEINRQEAFENNESIRNNNETIRIFNEKKREEKFNKAVIDETYRENNENSRVVSEKERIANEATRVASEKSRVEAEKTREAHYNDFNSSEADRKSNETARIEAEQNRKAGFINSETNRQNTFEENESIREIAFNINEKKRSDNEILRANAENTRKANEETRSSSEGTRVQSEKDRVTAEVSRVEAEKSREKTVNKIKNELGTEVLETEVQTIKGAINELKGQVENASSLSPEQEESINDIPVISQHLSENVALTDAMKTNFFGKEFSTPQERLLDDFQYLHMSGERGDFLPFSASKNHKVQESIEGKTRDMVLEGETLQNLISFREKDFNLGTWNTFIKGDINLFKCDTKYTIFVIVNKNGITAGEVTLSGMPSNVSTIFKDGNIRFGKNESRYYSGVFTTKDTFSGCTNIAFWAHDPGIVTGSLNTSIIILKGDWTNKPVPSYFEGIKSVGQDNNKISILSTGKNLFDNIYGNLSDVGLINQKCSSAIYYCKPSTTYTVTRVTGLGNRFRLSSGKMDTNGNISDVQSVGGYSDVLGQTGLNLSITTKSNHNFLWSYFNYSDENPKDLFQFEESTTSTVYEPYVQDKKDILLPFEGGLKGLPNGAKDILKQVGNKNILAQKIGKYEFNGDENLQIWRAIPDSLYIAFSLKYVSFLGIKPKRNSIVLSNKFIEVNTSVGLYNCEEEGIKITYPNESTGDIIAFGILKSKLQTPDLVGFKALLKHWKNEGNPLVIYYELTEPIEHDLTQDINLATYEGLTYIETESNSSFKAPVTITSTVARLNNENKALEQDNNRLQEDSKVLASAILNILEPMMLPSEDEEADFKDKELLEKLNKIVQHS